MVSQNPLSFLAKKDSPPQGFAKLNANAAPYQPRSMPGSGPRD
jgi:hypothetical protein